MTQPQRWRQVGLPFLVLRVTGQGTEFVAFVVLARNLDSHDFGRLAVAFVIARYAGLVGDWGASVRGARDVARSNDPAAIAALLRRRRHASALLVAAFVAGAAVLRRPEALPLAAVVAARGLNHDWLALGREQGARAGASSVVQGVVLAALAAGGRTSLAAAGVIAAGYAAGLAVSLAIGHDQSGGKSVRDSAGGDGVRPPVDGWILGSVLADQITITGDTLLLGWLASSSAAGIYAAVYRIPNAWMTLIGLGVVGSLPTAARQLTQAAGANASALQRRSLRRGMAVSAVILASSVPAYLLVPVLFGREYTSGRVPLLLLLVATATMALTASLQPLYVSLAPDREIFCVSASGASLNLLANVVAIPRWGMVGAASATLLTQVAVLALLWGRLHRKVAWGGSQ